MDTTNNRKVFNLNPRCMIRDSENLHCIMKGEQIECFDLVSDPDFSVFKCRNYGFAFSCPRPDWLTLSKLYKGFKAWRDMLIEFTNETERWLRDYHTCSIAESVSSTMSG